MGQWKLWTGELRSGRHWNYRRQRVHHFDRDQVRIFIIRRNTHASIRLLLLLAEVADLWLIMTSLGMQAHENMLSVVLVVAAAAAAVRIAFHFGVVGLLLVGGRLAIQEGLLMIETKSCQMHLGIAHIVSVKQLIHVDQMLVGVEMNRHCSQC